MVTDKFASLTTIVTTKRAAKSRVAALRKKVVVLVAPDRKGRVDLPWLLQKLGAENVTSLLVEGGGEVNASFLEQGLAHRVAFFYAPKILGGRGARPGIAGMGATKLADAIQLRDAEWQRVGTDLFLTARVVA